MVRFFRYALSGLPFIDCFSMKWIPDDDNFGADVRVAHTASFQSSAAG